MSKLEETFNVLLDCGTVAVEVTAGTLMAPTGVGTMATAVLYTKAALDIGQCANSAMRLGNELFDPERNKKLDENVYYRNGTFMINVLSIGKLGKTAVMRYFSPVSATRVVEVNKLLHEGDFFKRMLSREDAFRGVSGIGKENSKKLKRLIADHGNKSPLSNKAYKAMIWAKHSGQGSPYRLLENDLGELNAFAKDARKEFFELISAGFDMSSGIKDLSDRDLSKNGESFMDDVWLILEPVPGSHR